MQSDNKDKIIIALVIGIVLTLSYNFMSKKNDDEFVIQNDKAIVSDDNSLSNHYDSDYSNDNSNNFDSTIKVHISGEIKNPGVYDVDKDDRLDDLVKMAGGLSEKADIDRINLALKLEDQMRIIVPNINDKEKSDDQVHPITGESEENSKKVNINTAEKEELMTLPNIGEKRALAIIDYRQKNKFNKAEDIKNVSGIGDKYFEAMKDMIVVDWGFYEIIN